MWCLAGEANLILPVTAPPERLAEQISLREEASRLVAEIDAFERIRTVHPCPQEHCFSSSDVFTSRDSFDLDMLQTGHTGRDCVPDTLGALTSSLAHGDKPVLNGECSYEGVFDSCGPEVQRFLFWSDAERRRRSHLRHDADQLLQLAHDPHMPITRVSMHFWEDAIGWLGAEQVGVGKRILERLPWWELTPDPDALAPHAGPDQWLLPYAARTPGGQLVVYTPGMGMIEGTAMIVGNPLERLRLSGLDGGATYRATWANPRTGEDHSTFAFAVDGEGVHTLEPPPSFLGIPTFAQPTGEDWVLLVSPET